jgi:1-acyl-sn-glycerol-3-phosphate acyltransferase
MRLIAHGLALNRLKTVTHGAENIPARGPALIAARHYHHLFDGLALFAALPRRFHIVVTIDWAENRPAKYFFTILNRLARWPTLLRSEALIPCDDKRRNFYTSRDVQRYNRRALKHSVDLLVEGRLLIIFPEGYPNIDPTYTPKTRPDEFLPFKAGFVNIIGAAERRLQRKVPIIPAGLHYHQGTPWIAHLNFGSPIFRDHHRDKKALIETVEQTVKTLSESA